MTKPKAPLNRTVSLTLEEQLLYQSRLLRLSAPAGVEQVLGRTICQDLFEVLPFLPAHSVDLIFADPPYNLTKTFNEFLFEETSLAEYEIWLEQWVSQLVRLLKPTGSIYICGDWRSSTPIHRVLDRYFVVQNRITWEREKGRGAKTNWKNSSEDIWFATASQKYTFNVDEVFLKRRVMAPYTAGGQPKDWQESDHGRFRLTHPSNLWSDLTVPFWSMPENTDHPTQKPEKLLAKIILASSNPGEVVFDPFLGSGTTSVVAKKLGRAFFGVELDPTYACLAEKRLELAEQNQTIQGYVDGVFWERNSAPSQKRPVSPKKNHNN